MTDPLEQFCTPHQLMVLKAVKEHGGQRKAAKALGRSASSVDASMQSVRKKAARAGYSPEHDLTHPLAPGQMLRGASTLYKQGQAEPVMQWVKSSADAEQQAVMQRAALEAMCEAVPKVAASVLTSGTVDTLCNHYVLTDSHIGALAWDTETRSGDWDLNIAEKTLTGCFASMIKQSPDAKTCVIAQMGDFLHYDSVVAPVTPLHGNVLDADGRMPKMVKVAVRVLRRVIDMALTKHEKVILLLAEGNHDLSSSVWLRAMFQALYEDEPRIEVIDSELPYYCYEFGNTMLAWHHGHLAKNASLPLLFAAQFPKIWGNTQHRYCHTAHRHHGEEKEHSGMTVTQHPTLAARDSYSARGGWIAERKVTATTYHDRFGIVGSVTITPEMLS